MILKIKRQKSLYIFDDNEYLVTDISIWFFWIPIYEKSHSFEFESYESDPETIGY